MHVHGSARQRAAMLLGVALTGCGELLGVDAWGPETAPDTGEPDAGTSAASVGGDGGAAGAAATGGVGGGAGGGPPISCWEAAGGGWIVEDVDHSKLTGLTASDPMISPDGLTLIYSAFVGGTRRPLSVTRLDRASPFIGGALVAGWSGYPDVGRPWLSLGGVEMTMSSMGDLVVATFDGSTWSVPVPVTTLNTMTQDDGPSLTVDGERVIFQRTDGQYHPGLGGPNFRLHEATRSVPTPGAGFPMSATPVQLPTLGPEDAMLCPALSPDGTRLFFGTTEPLELTMTNKGHALTVWSTSRATRGDPWAAPTHIVELDSPTLNTCPNSVTDDGCEIWFHRFSLPPGTLTMHVARRTPPS